MNTIVIYKVSLAARLSVTQHTRLPFSVWKIGEQWPKLTDKHRHAIDKYWAPRVLQLDEQSHSSSGSKCYVLSMFPYPSGKLHMGHLRVYTVSDVLSRFQRLRGYCVIQPMGWDAFGLPAENAAIERNQKPDLWTYNNIAEMKKQMQEQMTLSIDWSRELATCSPLYYKWTQWLFLRLLEHGLAYRKTAEVNWDPVDNTVLADEQVDDEGYSWRSGALVEKRQLEQWYFKTSPYSQSLLQGLDEIDGNQWRHVVQAQRGWIGELDGTSVDFLVHRVDSDGEVKEIIDRISVFTRHPALVYLDAVSHIAINSSSSLYRPDICPSPVDDDPPLPHLGHYVNRSADGKLTVRSRLVDPLPVTGLNVVAVHPITKRKIPIIYRPDLKFQGCLDSEFGIPDLSECDRIIADANNFTWCPVLASDGMIVCYSDSRLNNLHEDQSFELGLKLLQDAKCGGHLTSSLQRDWLISRQRYWGTPIPIVYCDNCGIVPVSDKDLPVTLPTLDKFSGKGISPLKEAHDWINTTCPRCSAAAKRETDTMDTFVDSSWYFLRYLDSGNNSEMCDKQSAFRNMPVDIYIGGIEHAIRHLFYARFISHFLYDLGYLPEREPFRNFLPVGLVLGKTYQVKTTGKYLRPDEIHTTKQDGKKQVILESATNLEVRELWDKMSKSKHNGVDPELVVAHYGKDTTRLCMLSNAGPHRSRKWQEGDVMLGVMNWQIRLFKLLGNYVDQEKFIDYVAISNDPLINDSSFQNIRVKTLSEALYHYDKTYILSSIIARLHTYSDALRKVPQDIILVSPLYGESLCDLVVMLSPMAPLFSSELWAGLQHVLISKNIYQANNRFPYNMKHSVLEQRFPDGGIKNDLKSCESTG